METVIPQREKEDKENGDDYGVQLNLNYDMKQTQSIWFSEYLVAEPKAAKWMTTLLKMARDPQKHK